MERLLPVRLPAYNTISLIAKGLRLIKAAESRGALKMDGFTLYINCLERNVHLSIQHRRSSALPENISYYTIDAIKLQEIFSDLTVIKVYLLYQLLLPISERLDG